MIKITIDGFEVEHMRDVHQQFSRALTFPEYYGYNLDALWDQLTSLTEELIVEIKHKETLRQKLMNHYQPLMTLLKALDQEGNLSLLSGDGND